MWDSISFRNLYQDKTQKATFDLLDKVNDNNKMGQKIIKLESLESSKNKNLTLVNPELEGISFFLEGGDVGILLLHGFDPVIIYNTMIKLDLFNCQLVGDFPRNIGNLLFCIKWGFN